MMAATLLVFLVAAGTIGKADATGTVGDCVRARATQVDAIGAGGCRGVSRSGSRAFPDLEPDREGSSGAPFAEDQDREEAGVVTDAGQDGDASRGAVYPEDQTGVVTDADQDRDAASPAEEGPQHHHGPSGAQHPAAPRENERTDTGRPARMDPDPMAMMETMAPSDRWMTMLHGYAFVTANRQGGPSGDKDLGSQNHLMVMAMRRWAGGKLSFLGTFTLEPATIPRRGTALLFQRGESYQGVLLVDRQHPHDLFAQLAAAWERELSPRSTIRLYLAPEGEPAVGPTPYVHRLSASENPVAPLAHHNQDSTHITADVVTLGYRLGAVTLEGSAFHGREPDENRWNLDQGPIDSYSGRLSVRPIEGMSVQVSAARREHPEELEEGDQTRQTASVEYRRGLSGGFVAAALILGRNKLPDGIEWGNGLEATWRFAKENFLYARVETVDRDLYELQNKRQRPESVPYRRIAVQAATLGYARGFHAIPKAETACGAAFTAYRFDDRLDDVYGRRPISFQGFLRVRFGLHLGGGAETGAGEHVHQH